MSKARKVFVLPQRFVEENREPWLEIMSRIMDAVKAGETGIEVRTFYPNEDATALLGSLMGLGPREFDETAATPAGQIKLMGGAIALRAQVKFVPLMGGGLGDQFDPTFN